MYIFFYRFLLPALPQHLWAELQTQKSSAIEKTSKRYPMLHTYIQIQVGSKPELAAFCSDHRGREGSTVLACTYIRMSVHATVISCTVLCLQSAQHSMPYSIRTYVRAHVLASPTVADYWYVRTYYVCASTSNATSTHNAPHSSANYCACVWVAHVKQCCNEVMHCQRLPLVGRSCPIRMLSKSSIRNALHVFGAHSLWFN